MKFWPYEETRFELKDLSQGRFTIECPWLVSEMLIEPESKNFHALMNHIQNRDCPVDIEDVMHALETLPLAYRLPRREVFGQDTHELLKQLDLANPMTLAEGLGLADLAFFESEWTWDADAALSMASMAGSEIYDPLTLLTVVRRFHYLDCSDNKIKELYDRMTKIEDPERRKHALANIVRQNHYVTEQCGASLAPALTLAQSASLDVQNFMRAEQGHDKLLKRSLDSLGYKPADCEPTEAVTALMALLEASARLNFVAFCFNLDFFERPQFKDEDSLAETLERACEPGAAKALQIHKRINDDGDHDGVSLQFLSYAKPLEREYAMQAIRLAELTSFAIAQVPYHLEEMIEFDLNCC